MSELPVSFLFSRIFRKNSPHITGKTNLEIEEWLPRNRKKWGRAG